MAVRVMVAFRHYLFRECIVESFQRFELDLNIKIVSECECLDDLEQQYMIIRPDLLIVSVEILPRRNKQTIRVLERIIKDNPESKIIGVTTFYDNEVENALTNIGAKGYFFQTAELSDITKLLKGVIEGRNMMAQFFNKRS